MRQHNIFTGFTNLNYLVKDRSDPYANRPPRVHRIRDDNRPTAGESERIAAQAEKNSKDWIITDPHGVEHKVRNLSKFCRDHNLEYGSMQNAIKHNKAYLGWSAQLVAADPQVVELARVRKMIEKYPLISGDLVAGHERGLVLVVAGRCYLNDEEVSAEEGMQLVCEALGMKEQDGTN